MNILKPYFTRVCFLVLVNCFCALSSSNSLLADVTLPSTTQGAASTSGGPSEAETLTWLNSHADSFVGKWSTNGGRGEDNDNFDYVDHFALAGDNLVVTVRLVHDWTFGGGPNVAGGVYWQSYAYCVLTFPLKNLYLPLEVEDHSATGDSTEGRWWFQGYSIVRVRANCVCISIEQHLLAWGISYVPELKAEISYNGIDKGKFDSYQPILHMMGTNKGDVWLKGQPPAITQQGQYEFGFNDKELAQRFSKAFSHLIELHGGNTEPF
jgi:hypothetical protein